MDILSENMDAGLKKTTHPSASVKMFPSYVTKLPTGNESGRYLALDLGGTNYRVLLVTLEGGGKPPRISETVYAIPHDIMVGTGEALFDYIANTMEDFLKNHGADDIYLPLGFTFSFPCVQKGLDEARLVRWTKGFSASGVEGKDVCEILNKAIEKRKMKVRCVAVINDTVGTLTACALQDPKCAIGLIVGTGTNAAYIEDLERVETFETNGMPAEEGSQVVINMEWGAFGDDGALAPYLTEFDRQLDAESLNPGKQIFEKMISGMYLGELVRLVMLKLVKEGFLFHGHDVSILNEHGIVHTKYLTETERDPIHLFYSTNYMLTEDLKIPVVQPEDCHIVRYVCERVAARAAFLAGAGIACILNRLDRPEVTVGIDGSLFKFHPKFPERMIDMIHRLKKNNGQFVLRLSEDGSGKGAAAIAATAH